MSTPPHSRHAPSMSLGPSHHHGSAASLAPSSASLAPSHYGPSLHHAPSEISVMSNHTNAYTNHVMQNFRQEDVINAMMTHLREKEDDLKNMALDHRAQMERMNADFKATLEGQATIFEKNSRANSQRLQGAIDSQRNTLQENEGTISSLQLVIGEKDREAKEREEKMAVLEDHLFRRTNEAKELHHNILEMERIHDHDVGEFREMLRDTEEAADSKFATVDALEEKCHESDLKLQDATAQLTSLRAMYEEVEKETKGKKWVTKSLKDECEEQRKRENYHLSQIRDLQLTIEAYEVRFTGKDVDVPMVLARLKDSENSFEELDAKMDRLEKQNEKLGAIVIEKCKMCVVSEIHEKQLMKKLGAVQVC